MSGTITPATSSTYLLGGGGGTLEISSALVDIAGVTNLDVGTNGTARGRIILSGANTFTGTTTVSDGMVLQYASTASMGGGLITVNNPSSVTAGFAIDQTFIDKITTGSTGTAALGVDSGINLNFTNHASLRLGATGTATYTGILTPNGTTYRIGGGTGTLNFNSDLVDVGGAHSRRCRRRHRPRYGCPRWSREHLHRRDRINGGILQRGPAGPSTATV